MDSVSLKQRLQYLEDVEAIRSLKARYLASCDAKQPGVVRACFADGEVAIDYGAIGKFDNADALVAIYTQIACHPHMVEMHHGVNPQIEIIGPDSARGEWDAHYQLINTNDMTLTQLAGHYQDGYQRGADGWKISATRFEVTFALTLQLDQTAVKTLFAGRQIPAA